MSNWSPFPPNRQNEDMNQNPFAIRRLSPINDVEFESAEVKDIPLFRAHETRTPRTPSKETRKVKKTAANEPLHQTANTRELVALISRSPSPPNVPLKSCRKQPSIDQIERTLVESQDTQDLVLRLAQQQLDEPDYSEMTTPRKTDYDRYDDMSDTPRKHRRGLPLQMPTPMSESPRSASRASQPSSYQTDLTSLPALQQKGVDDDYLRPLEDEELDPGSFDLVAPAEVTGIKQYSLETRSEQLFSTEHLQVIFSDPSLLLRFTAFLGTHHQASIPVLIYYLDAIKALKAISYSNAITDALDPIEGFDFTKTTANKTVNTDLEDKAKQAFSVLVREDLPAFVTHTYIQTVSLSIQRRITGTLPARLRDASEGLAEVFCLTDPSRPDNPIVFASEEFHNTTQYGMGYVLGRNCRFLQGPKTNPFSVRRIREKIEAGVEHCEVFLNYRRDGSPFMNLLMTAPLCDSRGVIRYFIGAQVDVSGLVKECSDMESLSRLIDQSEKEKDEAKSELEKPSKDEFQDLSEMLNLQELETVRRWGGCMHKENQSVDLEDNTRQGNNWSKPRVLITSGSPDGLRSPRLGRASGKLSGIYEHYLLIRPYPSLRILFASPSLRVPGILQSPFIQKIGGSDRVRTELTQALADGRGVTAKVKWVSKTDPDGRNRWIHCTPLIGSNGAIGVWMIVLVDDEASQAPGKRFRMAPPVDPRFGRTLPVSHRDDGSLRDFAFMNGGREGSVKRGKGSIRSFAETERSASPYSLRIE